VVVLMKIFLHNTCLGIIERQFTIDAALSIEPTNYADNETAEQPHLLKRFGLVQATALDRSNMIGVGPLITIPLLMSTLSGPQGAGSSPTEAEAGPKSNSAPSSRQKLIESSL